MSDNDVANNLNWSQGEIHRAEQIINADRPDDERYMRAQTHAQMAIAHALIALVNTMREKGN